MKQFFPKLAMMAAMLLSFLQASAYNFEADGIYFNITDATNHEVAVAYYGTSVKYAGDINIPATVTNEGTTYSVTSIGRSAFSKCTNLISVTIPTSVTAIGAGAFNGCSGLTNITIPTSVTSIGGSAFNGCSGLTNVTIPNSVTAIENSTFNGCSGLTNVTIPTSVTSIGERAFQSCTSLTTVTIPNSVSSIGGYAFFQCEGLTSITISNSVTSIGDYAFGGCVSLIEINVDSANSLYASVDGVLYNKTLTEIILYPAGKPETTFSIPSSVTSIGNDAFRGCSGLTSITIPNSVTSIGIGAFVECERLTSINIPSSVTSIGVNAFGLCKGLIEINVDTSNSFYASVDGVLYNKSLTEIIRYPTDKTESSFSFTIPGSVTSIGDWAFEGCWHLTKVTIPNSVTSIGNYAFRNCNSLRPSITIPSSVTSIGDYAFQDCSGLTSITIPESVTSMGYAAFYGCTLESVYCNWEEPITADNNLFIAYSYKEGTLYVPKGCAGKYGATSPWSKFEKIEELENLGVDDIVENQPTGDYIVYDLQGVMRISTADLDEVKQLPAGVYIVNGKKILIK